MDIYPDWIGVFIAAVLNVAIGAIWYSNSLFGKEWARLTGQKEEGGKEGIGRILVQFLLSFLLAFVIDFLERHLEITTVTDGMFVSFCFWIGFAVPTELGSILKRREPLLLFAINGGYRLVAYLAMGGLIAS